MYAISSKGICSPETYVSTSTNDLKTHTAPYENRAYVLSAVCELQQSQGSLYKIFK